MVTFPFKYLHSCTRIVQKIQLIDNEHKSKIPVQILLEILSFKCQIFLHIKYLFKFYS